ncbi:MAG: prepilin-type N-terminal cleavage/methylation domain-containing protein [Thermodesulfobacteriota bacterium]
MKRLNKSGVTLIELLIALVICGMLAAGIYKVFIAQSKAYTVQDQVTEVQQSVRSAMEILLRDLRMAGFDSDHLQSTVTIVNPLANLSDSSITVNYEYFDKALAQYQKHTIAYWLDVDSSSLIRQLTVNDVATPAETLLTNVEKLEFDYGIANEDGALDHWLLEGPPTDPSKVVAVRVTLTARPLQVNPDLQKVYPRTLTSNVTLRNLCMMR